MEKPKNEVWSCVHWPTTLTVSAAGSREKISPPKAARVRCLLSTTPSHAPEKTGFAVGAVWPLSAHHASHAVFRFRTVLVPGRSCKCFSRVTRKFRILLISPFLILVSPSGFSFRPRNWRILNT